MDGQKNGKKFINYAHRGASTYTPENTFLAFYTGIYMGANGIETDVQKTKDGVLVLFHDTTITRLTGVEGALSDYTLEELKQFTFEKDGLCDKIVVFEDFLKQFAFRDITFAIEIKQAGIEAEIADMMRKFHLEQKAIVTSFMPECIAAIKEYAPEFRIGLLCREITDDTIIITMTEDQKKKVMENYEGFLEVATIYEYAGEIGDIKDPYGKSQEEYECCFLQIQQLVDKIWKIRF